MIGTKYLQDYLNKVLPQGTASELEEVAIGWMFTLALNEVMPGYNFLQVVDLCWKDSDKTSLAWGIVASSGAGIDEFEQVLNHYSKKFKGAHTMLEYFRDNAIDGVDMNYVHRLLEGIE